MQEREKQIEEMADDLMACHSEFETGVGEIYTDYATTAYKMFSKGYRKQSEGEWIDEDDIWYRAELLHYRCSICGNHDYLKENFCSKCGAKMKGGAE